MLKKYPNRRLYDMDGSRYVLMIEALPRLLMGERVMSHATGMDVTREVLVSALVELVNHKVGPDVVALREFIKANWRGWHEQSKAEDGATTPQRRAVGTYREKAVTMEIRDTGNEPSAET